MNNCCICWFFTHILLGILIFKGLPARRLYKSFGVKRLISHVTQLCKLYLLVVHFSIYGRNLRQIIVTFKCDNGSLNAVYVGGKHYKYEEYSIINMGALVEKLARYTQNELGFFFKFLPCLCETYL
jgi:hypothetical protein